MAMSGENFKYWAYVLCRISRGWVSLSILLTALVSDFGELDELQGSWHVPQGLSQKLSKEPTKRPSKRLVFSCSTSLAVSLQKLPKRRATGRLAA